MIWYACYSENEFLSAPTETLNEKSKDKPLESSFTKQHKLSQLSEGKTLEDIKSVYEAKYTGPVVTYCDSAEGGFLSAAALSGKDAMHVYAYGNDDRIILTAVYDNLGKGASGAALECMNYVLGNDPTEGLEI